MSNEFVLFGTKLPEAEYLSARLVWLHTRAHECVTRQVPIAKQMDGIQCSFRETGS
jgi:hypothetical protein